MSNPNLSSLLFIYLMIISSRSFISICTAYECNDVGFRQQLLFGTATNDEPQTTFGPRKILEFAEGGPEFDYLDGPLGPANWGNIKPEWKICNTGRTQSPINIEHNKVQVAQCDLKVAYRDAPAQIINAANTIGIRWIGDAGGIEINGSTYKLIQCHWHTPSEHTVDGMRSDAELHLVHKNNMGQLAVVGILHNIGSPDPFIAHLEALMSALHVNEEIGVQNINAANIKFGSKRNFRYFGSLTTPPCSENVIWTVEERVRSISQEQIHLLSGTHQAAYQRNSRPVQQLGDRQIWIIDLPDTDV